MAKWDTEIERHLDQYRVRLEKNSRYSAWDHCYAHFQLHRDNPASLGVPLTLQISCLQLWSYLASWGMMRGPLGKFSAPHLKTVIEYVAYSCPNIVWTLDVDQYSQDGAIDALLSAKRCIDERLDFHASDTLLTKIMLGVFGNVPAFDRNFKEGSGLSRCDVLALKNVKDYYGRNSRVIDFQRANSVIASFEPTPSRPLLYSRARVIDMIGFIAGGG